MNRFVFLITCFNEEKGIVKTLKSIYAQSYDNWRVIIRNDVSTDDTANIIEEFKINHKIISDKITLINNKRKFGEVENTLDTLNIIEEDEIICRIDAGDWLVDNDILYLINNAYKENNDLDVLWTSHRWGYTTKNISNGMPLGCDVYKHPWVSSHMKTFRRSAFHDIPDSNFRDDAGEYIMIACDQAIFLPLLHKTNIRGRKYGHFPLIAYHYNIKTDDPSIYQTERAYRQRDSAVSLRKRGYLEN